MSEYNEGRISFLTEGTKKLVVRTQKINAIIGLILHKDSYSFGFNESVNLYKKGGNPDLDGFCYDETISHYVLKKEPKLTSAIDREVYFLSLRNHLLRLQKNGEL